MSLTSFTMRNKAALSAMVAVATGWGVVSYMTMPRRADPDFTIRTCQVITSWPGTDAHRIEELVTYPLEQEINTLSEVDALNAVTKIGEPSLSSSRFDGFGPTAIAPAGNARSRNLPTWC